MYTLYLDTHYSKIVIVLYKNEKLLAKKEIDCSYNHSINTMPELIALLKENNLQIKEINEIVVCNGPGSFTGIRIGVTIAKTLAYTLNIPIKEISSLQIKAISFEHKKITIVEREKNGVFIGIFDENNHLIGEYKYLKNSEYNESNISGIEEIEIDYEKLITYAKTIESISPHSVKPLYVKKIEVQK